MLDGAITLETLMPSFAWYAYWPYRIVSFDGWRQDDFGTAFFVEPVTLAEFHKRAVLSTNDGLKTEFEKSEGLPPDAVGFMQIQACIRALRDDAPTEIYPAFTRAEKDE